MMRFEYKVVPAPTRGQKGKGVKGNDGKFANALEMLMNEMGAQGWDYRRAETLPSEERAGLTSKTSVFRNVLVFRRPLETELDAFAPKLLDAPAPDAALANSAQEGDCHPPQDLSTEDNAETAAAQESADELEKTD